MATWPIDLPSAPLLEGYQEQAPDTVIRTEMDAGPPKVRRRYTAGVRPFRMTVSLTKAQVATLDAFFTSTLQGGALRFDWTHPRTGASVEFRFTAPPTYRALADDVWRADLALEVLP